MTSADIRSTDAAICFFENFSSEITALRLEGGVRRWETKTGRRPAALTTGCARFGIPWMAKPRQRFMKICGIREEIVGAVRYFAAKQAQVRLSRSISVPMVQRVNAGQFVEIRQAGKPLLYQIEQAQHIRGDDRRTGMPIHQTVIGSAFDGAGGGMVWRNLTSRRKSQAR